MSSKPKLWGRISSDVTALSKLQVFYKFIPTAETVRPSEKGKAAKAARLERILATYVDMPDYIYHTVFGRPVVASAESDEKLTCCDVLQDPGLSAFAANEFPYDIERGNHSIMWYAVKDKTKSDENITEDIAHELRKLLQCGEESPFDFAWYENPKMSIPEFFHVQVFWVCIDDGPGL